METYLKRYLKPLLGVFFLFAGANHFANPEFYLPLIPDYLPSPALLNVLSGLIEVALGVLLFVPRFTKLAAYGIMVFLVILIPSHIYFIQIGSCIEGGLCIPEWFAWVRLVVVQPLFILWAWLVSKN
jgi:uncharacterized membrane protein